MRLPGNTSLLADQSNFNGQSPIVKPDNVEMQDDQADPVAEERKFSDDDVEASDSDDDDMIPDEKQGEVGDTSALELDMLNQINKLESEE